MIKRILVGLGGTDYTPAAVAQAVSLALAHDAEVTGVSVIDPKRLARAGGLPLVGGQDAGDQTADRLGKAKERAQKGVQTFAELCGAANVRHQVMHEVGDPFTLMIDQARYHDLMIFGLRSLFEYDLVSNPRDALVRLVQSGVRPLIAVARAEFPVHKVLIAYSGSMESAKAMKRFVQLRLWPHAKLRIVVFEHAAQEAEQLLGDAAEYCQAHGFETETNWVPESPMHQLLPYASQWGADLIVVGNSAKNLLLRRVFGETALHVIQHADRALFLAQ